MVPLELAVLGTPTEAATISSLQCTAATTSRWTHTCLFWGLAAYSRSRSTRSTIRRNVCTLHASGSSGAQSQRLIYQACKTVASMLGRTKSSKFNKPPRLGKRSVFSLVIILIITHRGCLWVQSYFNTKRVIMNLTLRSPLSLLGSYARCFLRVLHDSLDILIGLEREIQQYLHFADAPPSQEAL